MSEMHFDQMAAEYAEARPPYPGVIFETLEAAGVIGRGRRVLEVGAGAGLATRELPNRGSDVVAVEPGPHLASLIDPMTGTNHHRSATGPLPASVRSLAPVRRREAIGGKN